MAAESHIEIERKFEVAPDTDVPDLRGVTSVTAVGAPSTTSLDAVYFDTEDFALASARITLRRRTGGADEGWHLKLPVAGDRREELRLALGEADHEPPSTLLDRVRVRVRDRPLVPVARIRTVRMVHPLLGERGRVLAELCDDRVTADRLLPPTSSSRWHEWELELVEGTVSLLEEATVRLLEGGASPAMSGSKLARTLGAAPAAPARSPCAPPVSAGEVLVAYLGAQLEQLKVQDPRVRLGTPDSVHKMRVAARRARSALATYEELFEPGSADALRADLSWLGSVLGEVRDAEVLRDRLDALLQGHPGSDARELVARRIGRELDARFKSGTSHAAGLLESQRYFRLLDALERFLDSPPFTDRAQRPAEREVSRLVRRDWGRVTARAATARHARDAAERDLALHEVRKAAKRLRYAAESAVPVLSDRGEVLAMHSAAIQDALGDHHDSSVARSLLRKVAVDSGDAVHGSVLEDLHAREEEHARGHEREYEAALGLLPTTHRRRWLRESPNQ